MDVCIDPRIDMHMDMWARHVGQACGPGMWGPACGYSCACAPCVIQCCMAWVVAPIDSCFFWQPQPSPQPSPGPGPAHFCFAVWQPQVQIGVGGTRLNRLGIDVFPDIETAEEAVIEASIASGSLVQVVAASLAQP